MNTLVAIAVAYLIGSLSMARLAARTSGIDITSVGSGNPGATNVARSLGKTTGAVVLIGDLLKGVAGSLLGLWLIGDVVGGFVGGAAAVVGHCLPVWYGFRGGKGVATAAGMVMVNVWVVGLVLTAVWAMLIRLVKISSVASLAVVALAVPGVWWVTRSGDATLIMAGVAALIAWRHRANIQRLLAGSEGTVV